SALFLSGCALTPAQINLHYQQQKNATRINGAGNVSVNVLVKDRRSDKTRVGSKVNGFGMKTAPITAGQDVTETIRKAIERELVARGFQVASPDDASVQITARLTQFHSDFHGGFFSRDAVAVLNMGVVVKSKSGDMLYQTQVFARGVN